MEPNTTTATLAQLKDIAAAPKTIMPLVEPVAGSTDFLSGSDNFMGDVLKVLDKVDSILGKAEQFKGLFGKIADNKMLATREPEKTNPVLEAKREEPVSPIIVPPPSAPVASQNEQVSLSPKTNNEAAASPTVAPATESTPAEPEPSAGFPLMKPLNESKLEEFSERMFEAYLEKLRGLSDEWKNKTVAQILAEYDSKGTMTKMLIKGAISLEIKTIVEGGVKVASE